MIGVPDEDIGAWTDAGIVHVLKGTSTGLTGTGSQTWSQYSPGIAEDPEAGDRFGSSLAVGDLGGSVAARPRDRRARGGRSGDGRLRRRPRPARLGYRAQRDRQLAVEPGLHRASATPPRPAMASAPRWRSATSAAAPSATWLSACRARTSAAARTPASSRRSPARPAARRAPAARPSRRLTAGIVRDNAVELVREIAEKVRTNVPELDADEPEKQSHCRKREGRRIANDQEHDQPAEHERGHVLRNEMDHCSGFSYWYCSR